MESNLRTLGPKEARVILNLQSEGQDVITLAEVVDLLGGRSGHARKLLHDLTKKGWLVRLGAGKYILVPPDRGPENVGENNAIAMASAAVEPSYVGWWAAAAFHGFTTQRPVQIAVATIRQLSPRVIEGDDVRFVKVSLRKFFGATSYELYGRKAMISTPQKTLVDCIDRPDLCGGLAEVVRITYGAKSVVDPGNFAEAATKMGSVSLLQRSGFLCDLVGWKIPAELRSLMREKIPRSARSLLGPASTKADDIGYVPDWGLIVHSSRQELVADVPQLAER